MKKIIDSLFFIMIMIIGSKNAFRNNLKTVLKKQLYRIGSLKETVGSLKETVTESNQIFDVVLPTNDDISLLKVRHSTAHVMAMAVQKIYPNIKVTIGPWIENGYTLIA